MQMCASQIVNWPFDSKVKKSAVQCAEIFKVKLPDWRGTRFGRQVAPATEKSHRCLQGPHMAEA